MTLMYSLFVIISIILGVFILIAYWKVYEKAGRQGWEGIIPVYREYVLSQITGKPLWWFLFIYLLPPVGIVLLILMNIELADRFGKSTAFGLGIFFITIVFIPILAFGDATFRGPRGFNNPDVLDSDLI